MKMQSGRFPKPGEMVVFTKLPSGFLDDLPAEDQRAFSDVLGKPVLLHEYDEDGRAELEFADQHGVIHFIYLDPQCFRLARRDRSVSRRPAHPSQNEGAPS